LAPAIARILSRFFGLSSICVYPEHPQPALATIPALVQQYKKLILIRN